MRTQNPTTKCRGCNAEIAFVGTRSGKLMPIDADSLNDEDIEILGRVGERLQYEHGRHEPHHATCPEAVKFRRK